MLNKVWFCLLFIGIVYGFARASYESMFLPEAKQPSAVAEESDAAKADEVLPEIGFGAMGKRLNAAMLDAADLAVKTCIFLIGIMALWLGILNIAKDAGLVDAFARLLQPLMRLLFPEIPTGHPAQGAVLMNLSANMLGLDNAATPMGLKAMRELQELNPAKDTATNSMAMFLAINTSSVTLIPFTIIGLRAAAGSKNPAEPVLSMLLATLVSTIIAILITRWMAGWRRFRVAADSLAADGDIPPSPVEEEAPR
ncbi:MAG: nucleoside recognition protein [Planctomycetes bacterium]|nr:nucleoside recognition protein [Planctomycetota bacterium]